MIFFTFHDTYLLQESIPIRKGIETKFLNNVKIMYFESDNFFLLFNKNIVK